mgnify:CR=1 FL=1
MQGCGFDLMGAELLALPTGALHWPAAGLVAVSDLHFGKSDRIARGGGTLLPPYEVTDTLLRLDAVLARTDARTVVCLGDSFDDLGAADLAEEHRLWLLRLMAGRSWIWIAGNHDPAPVDLPGTHLADLTVGPLTFRHIAEGEAGGEVSGHFHPKLRLAGQSRPCFVTDGRRLILPAFGTYTGGLDAREPVIRGLFGTQATAILTGHRALRVPLGN